MKSKKLPKRTLFMGKWHYLKGIVNGELDKLKHDAKSAEKHSLQLIAQHKALRRCAAQIDELMRLNAEEFSKLKDAA